MSVGTGTADPPSPLISPATASRSDRLRAAIITLAPAAANARAIALPMPLLAPVTTATRFSSCFIAPHPPDLDQANLCTGRLAERGGFRAGSHDRCDASRRPSDDSRA